MVFNSFYHQILYKLIFINHKNMGTINKTLNTQQLLMQVLLDHIQYLNIIHNYLKNNHNYHYNNHHKNNYNHNNHNHHNYN